MGEEYYVIPVSKGILTPEHYQRIGKAIWVFIWFIDRTTKETITDGDRWGLVLGGKPIIAEMISEDLGISQQMILRYIRQLKKHGYIKTKKAPYGLIVSVAKSKKFWNRQPIIVKAEEMEQEINEGL